MGMGRKGSLSGLYKGRGALWVHAGDPPREKGPTVVATRAEMAVKKAGSGGYGDSDSKRRHEWALNSIERRLRQAFCLTDRTPHSAGAQLKNAPLCRRSNSPGPEPARKAQNMCASRRKANARAGDCRKGQGRVTQFQN